MIEVFRKEIAVAAEAWAKAEARAAELATQCGSTREAVAGFFRIIGEQDVPVEQLAVKLSEIATRHRALLDRWSVLEAPDLVTDQLAEQARAAIDAGCDEEADALLLRAREQEIAAALQAEQLAREAQQAAAVLVARSGNGQQARRPCEGKAALCGSRAALCGCRCEGSGDTPAGSSPLLRA